MVFSGPTPKSPETRARRNKTVAMTRLPKSGRTGRTPKWPLPKPAKADALSRHTDTVWHELWTTPQAVQWERMGAGTLREVAAYARFRAMADYGDLDAQRESRLLGDRLGLTPAAMLRLRWEVVDDDVVPAAGAATGAGARTSQRYGNLRSIGAAGTDGAAAAEGA